MSKGDMSISAFARRSLLSVKALRLYDENGLLRPERIDPSSGYRYYSESQLDTARLISLMRKLDVPIADIAEMIARDPSETSSALAAWWEIEEGKMDARRDLSRFIQGIVLNNPASRPSGQDAYPVQVRDVPETTYLYLMSHVHGPELPSFIGRSTAMLAQRAELYGGATGHATVVFHGVVDLDSDGPAEVWVPVGAGTVAEGEDLIRTESAHRQAYIALQKHQVAFPQILQVYVALRQWIEASNHTVSGPPREIYLDDFVEARHNELICEVAFPIHFSKGTDHE